MNNWQLYELWTYYKDINKDIELFFDILAKNINRSTTVFAAVSWWSDSLLLLYILHQYFIINNIPLQQLIVLHYHHQQRTESDQEFSDLQKHCLYYDVPYVCASFVNSKSKKATEKELRDSRYRFFMSCLYTYQHIYIYEKFSCHLVLWHHLDDRIETSFLNLQRWCSLDGFLNMNLFQYHDLYGIYLHRPLLFTTKKEILHLCNTYWIHFFEDSSNYDHTVSLRNWLRSQLCRNDYNILRHEKRKKLYENLYSFLTEVDKISSLVIQDLHIPKIRKWVDLYLKVSNINQPYDVYILLRKLKIFTNMSTWKILSLYLTITQGQWWVKIWGLVIYIYTNYIYILRYTEHASTSSWIPIPIINNEYMSSYIDQINILSKKNNEKIVVEHVLLSKLCLWIKEIRIWSKSYLRRAIHQKIPVFFRCSILFVGDQRQKRLFLNRSQLIDMGFL